MVTLAIPFLLVFAVYFLPLNLKITFKPFLAFLLIFKVACKTSFLADFLTLTFLSVKVILSAFLGVTTAFSLTVTVKVFE